MTKSTGIGRGGARPGSGRKKVAELAALEQLARDVRDRAARILAAVDGDEKGEEAEWRKLLRHKDPAIRLRARVELSKLAYPIPKPVDAKVAGKVEIHFHRIDPKWKPRVKRSPDEQKG